MSMFIFILILIGLFAISFGIGYIILRREIGSKAAAREFRRRGTILGVSVIIVIIGVCLYRFFPGSWRDHARVFGSLLMTVVFWAFIVTWLRRKKQAGSVLLDLGRTKGHKVSLIGGGVVAVDFIISLVDGLLEAGGATGIKEISFNIAFLSFGLFLLLIGLSHIEIREHGIFYLDRFIKWENIESYEWEGKKGITLTLRVRGRLSFFRTLSLPIPASHKETMENLLARYFQGDKSII